MSKKKHKNGIPIRKLIRKEIKKILYKHERPTPENIQESIRVQDLLDSMYAHLK